jgi:hypothetical protein
MFSHGHVSARARCEQKTAATMAERLSSEQRKAVLKWYYKYKTIKEVLSHQHVEQLPVFGINLKQMVLFFVRKSTHSRGQGS